MIVPGDDECLHPQEYTRSLLFKTATVQALERTKNRLETEARRMQGNRMGILMDNYHTILEGRAIVDQAADQLLLLRQSLVDLKKSIEKAAIE